MQTHVPAPKCQVTCPIPLERELWGLICLFIFQTSCPSMHVWQNLAPPEFLACSLWWQSSHPTSFPIPVASLCSSPPPYTIPRCAPLPAPSLCVTSKWGECHGLLCFTFIGWSGLTFWQVEVYVLFNILVWRFFHCGFWKDTLHTRFFLKLLSSLPFFGIRKRITKGKPFPCHHCPAHLFKSSHIYLCLISSPHFPTSWDGNADQMGLLIWVELCRSSPNLEISSSPSKVLWATRKKTTRQQNVGKTAKYSVSVGGIYS